MRERERERDTAIEKERATEILRHRDIQRDGGEIGRNREVILKTKEK